MLQKQIAMRPRNQVLVRRYEVLAVPQIAQRCGTLELVLLSYGPCPTVRGCPASQRPRDQRLSFRLDKARAPQRALLLGNVDRSIEPVQNVSRHGTEGVPSQV